VSLFTFKVSLHFVSFIQSARSFHVIDFRIMRCNPNFQSYYDKTKCLIFNTNGRLLNSKFTINNKVLENVRHYRYLGVTFSASGSFTEAKSELYKKGLKAFYKLRTSFCDSLPKISTFLHIFDHTIQPILLYGSEIWGAWGPSKLDNCSSLYKLCNEIVIEKLHSKSLKCILGVNRKSTSSAVMAELGRFPLFFTIILNMIKYWVHLENSGDTLLKEALFVSKSLHENGKESWYSCVVKVLELLDLNPCTTS